MRVFLFSFFLLLPWFSRGGVVGDTYVDITVAADGSGDFTTLTAAVQALPMYTYERVVVFIKKGVYQEKIRIEQDNLTLLGEDRDSTIIQYNQLREDWQRDKDAIGPAVINIHADDVALRNLTIINTQPEIGPHAFTIYGTGTRTVLYNCTIRSKGGDTVSLWNYKQGLYYHARCYFEGAVDFVCPRGWCYITDSRFYELRPRTAAIWHAAATDERQRLVIRNSIFDGVEGFELGRHHYDAQFFLLDCTFAESMADRPIYHVVYPDEPERNRPYFWGDRYYFFNTHRQGGDFDWHRDNITRSGMSPDSITAAWTFDQQWDPECTRPPQLLRWQIAGNQLFLYFDEALTIRGTPSLQTAAGTELTFVQGRGRAILQFSAAGALSPAEFSSGELRLSDGAILATQAGIYERALPEFIPLPKG